jgi:hypothetical protein
MGLLDLLGQLGQVTGPAVHGYTGGLAQGQQMALQFQQMAQARKMNELRALLEQQKLQQDAEQFRLTQTAREREGALEALMQMSRPFSDPATLAAAERSGQLEALMGDADFLAKRAGVPRPSIFQARLPDAQVPNVRGMVGGLPAISPETMKQFRFSEPESAITERFYKQAQGQAALANAGYRDSRTRFQDIQTEFAPGLFGSTIRRNEAGANLAQSQADLAPKRFQLDEKKFNSSLKQWAAEFNAGRQDSNRRFGFQERMTRVAEAAQQIRAELAQIQGELFESQIAEIKQRVAQRAAIDPVFKQVLENFDGLFDKNPYTGTATPNAQKMGALSDLLTMAGSTAGEYIRQIGQDLPANPMVPNSQPGIPSMFPPSPNQPPPILSPVPGGWTPPPSMFPNFERTPGAATQGTVQPARVPAVRPSKAPGRSVRQTVPAGFHMSREAFQSALRVDKDKEFVGLVRDAINQGKASAFLQNATPQEKSRFIAVFNILNGENYVKAPKKKNGR